MTIVTIVTVKQGKMHIGIHFCIKKTANIIVSAEMHPVERPIPCY